MTNIEKIEGNVIYGRFRRPVASAPQKVTTGVFIKPSGVSETLYSLRGNVAGFIASYIAFHPEFSPSLFGRQVRRELGVSVGNDDPEPPEAA